jgi:hypothetical protein
MPSQGADQMQAGEEIARSFLVADRGASELFVELKETLDEVAFGVEGEVAIAFECADSRRDAMSDTRKLAAILVADVVGYSRLAGADEDRTLARLRGGLRSDLIDPQSPPITAGSTERGRRAGRSPRRSATEAKRSTPNSRSAHQQFAEQLPARAVEVCELHLADRAEVRRRGVDAHAG